MAFTLPKGWEKDSDKLFVHTSGVRIQRMTYRQQEGWFLVPVDLDQAVVPFDPTPEGRDKAFEAYANGALGTKPKAKPKKTSKAKAKPAEAESEEDDSDEEEGTEEKGDSKAEEEADQGDDD